MSLSSPKSRPSAPLASQDNTKTDVGSGSYDRLYSERDFLWPSEPGRMVKDAVSRCRPGRALDAGCGDGKNALFLAQLGWTIDCFDISLLAIDACHRRLSAVADACNIWRDDCRSVDLETEAYDMIIAYGLYHCLDDIGLTAAHARLTDSLKRGGLFVCATFNDLLPLPAEHGTGILHLRAHDHLEGLFAGWNQIRLQKGKIGEDHFPSVGFHQHSLTWAVYEKVA